MVEPGTVAVESALDYAGYYLDFTLTNEDGLTLSYWPQGAGDTRQELKLDRGRFLVRVRSVRSGCRTFSLTLSHVGRRF